MRTNRSFISKLIPLYIAMVILANHLYAQSVDKVKSQLDSLSKMKIHLESDLANTVKLIDSKTKLLNDLQSQELDKSLQLTATKELTALDIESTANGKKVFAIKKGDVFKVLSFDNDFYFVEYRNLNGYIYYVNLNGVTGTEEFKAFWIKRNAERRKSEKQAELIASKSDRSKALAEKFGSQYSYAIMQGKIWIGMTDAMARESIGSPDKINKSTLASGVHEQWVYKNRYLYFENGVLSSWQDQK